MSIKADFHMHSEYSFDSEAPIEEMIKSAIKKGLDKICFTEHYDAKFPVNAENPQHAWECNIDSYLYDLLTTRENYEKQIAAFFGLEIGLQEDAFVINSSLAEAHEYDFLIGSVHLVNKKDPYWPDYFDNTTDKEATKEYLLTVLNNVKKFHDFDVLGHLDYIVRNIPGGEKAYSPSDYMDIVEEILKELIKNEIGIEVNTAALIKGFNNPNPHPEIIKRYKELGGDIITVGSDAHVPENIGGKFDIAEDMLKNAGFDYYCTFTRRGALYHKF